MLLLPPPFAPVRRRGVMGVCSALTGLQCGKRPELERMSLCDGRGCLEQLASVRRPTPRRPLLSAPNLLTYRASPPAPLALRLDSF